MMEGDYTKQKTKNKKTQNAKHNTQNPKTPKPREVINIEQYVFENGCEEKFQKCIQILNMDKLFAVLNTLNK